MYISAGLTQSLFANTNAPGADAAGVKYANWLANTFSMIKGSGDIPIPSQIGTDMVINMIDSTALFVKFVRIIPIKDTEKIKTNGDIDEKNGIALLTNKVLMPVASEVR